MKSYYENIEDIYTDLRVCFVDAVKDNFDETGKILYSELTDDLIKGCLDYTISEICKSFDRCKSIVERDYSLEQDEVGNIYKKYPTMVEAEQEIKKRAEIILMECWTFAEMLNGIKDSYFYDDDYFYRCVSCGKVERIKDFVETFDEDYYRNDGLCCECFENDRSPCDRCGKWRRHDELHPQFNNENEYYCDDCLGYNYEGDDRDECSYSEY